MKKIKNSKLPAALSIAGSDSGGGAGIQTDLKTFNSLKVWGTTAITCITAQNPAEVRAVMPVAPAIVEAQINTVAAGFDVRAVKTGMLFNSSIIHAVVRELKKQHFPFVVVDPVMVATSGARLLKDDAVKALTKDLLPLADIITPNIPEAEVLAELKITDLASQQKAAQKIAAKYSLACVVKGGHGKGKQCADVLVWQGQLRLFKHGRVPVKTSHGTGCTFSAALAAWLMRGKSIVEAVRLSRQYVRRMLLVELAKSKQSF